MAGRRGATGGWRPCRVLAALAIAAPAALAAPVEGPLESVVFEAGDTIRGVAERYLKDADLWPQILELSGVALAGRAPARRAAARAGAAGRRRRRGARLLARRDPEGDGGGRAHLRARSRSARDREPRHRGRAPRRGRLGRGRDLRRHRDRVRRPGARDLARPARPGGGGGGLRRAGQRRGPRARPAALVAAGGRGRAGRVRAGAHALGLDGAGDVPRPEPAPAQPELERHHPADAQRPADRRRGDQGQPGQRRLLRAPEPARRPHRLRGRRCRGSRPRPSRRTSGSSTSEGESRFANYDAAGARDHPRRRDDQPRRERGRGGARRRRRRAHRGAGARGARRRPSTARRSTTRRSPSPGSPPRAPRATGSRWRRTPTST